MDIRARHTAGGRMIHREIEREGAEVWVVCPQCLNESDAHCAVCDDLGQLPLVDAAVAIAALRTHPLFFRRGIEPAPSTTR
jgi:hypothetical protein